MPTFGAYETRRILSQSDQCTVHAAATRQDRTERYALKVWTHRTDSDPHALDMAPRRFLFQVILQQRVAAREGAHWAPIHDLGTDSEASWAATDLYAATLADLIHEEDRGRPKVAIAERDLFSLTQDIVAGLMELQEIAGREHGNLKPSNVLLAGTRPPRNARAMLTDLRPTQFTDPLKGRRRDLRAVGELIYGMALGRPFPGDDAWEFEPTAPWEKLSRAHGVAWWNLVNDLVNEEAPAAIQTLEDLYLRLADLRPSRRTRRAKSDGPSTSRSPSGRDRTLPRWLVPAGAVVGGTAGVLALGVVLWPTIREALPGAGSTSPAVICEAFGTDAEPGWYTPIFEAEPPLITRAAWVDLTGAIPDGSDVDPWDLPLQTLTVEGWRDACAGAVTMPEDASVIREALGDLRADLRVALPAAQVWHLEPWSAFVEAAAGLNVNPEPPEAWLVIRDELDAVAAMVDEPDAATTPPPPRLLERGAEVQQQLLAMTSLVQEYVALNERVVQQWATATGEDEPVWLREIFRRTTLRAALAQPSLEPSDVETRRTELEALVEAADQLVARLDEAVEAGTRWDAFLSSRDFRAVVEGLSDGRSGGWDAAEIAAFVEALGGAAVAYQPVEGWDAERAAALAELDGRLAEAERALQARNGKQAELEELQSQLDEPPVPR